MKTLFPFGNQVEVIARFGKAALIRDSKGSFELRGGDVSDQTAAREWVSLFLHDAVPRVKPCLLR